MGRWTIEEPASIALDTLTDLKIRVVAGHIDVLVTDERPRIEVTEVQGPPLLVREEDGEVVVTYEDLTWEGLTQWLRPRYRRRATITAMVPADCAVEVGVVGASAVVAGVTGKTTIRAASGDITLDGVGGDTLVQTVSGDLEARDITGSLGYNTVNGDLTIAGGTLQRIDAKTVNSKVVADIDLTDACRLHLATVSGYITLRVPDEPGGFIELRSTSGKTSSSFEGLECTNRPGGSSLTGRVGHGTGSVTATAVSGDVTLLRRDTGAAGEEQE